MTQEVQKLDRKDMKILALRQRIAEIVVEYEDKDADRRIEITELAERAQKAEAELAEVREASDVQEEPLADETSE